MKSDRMKLNRIILRTSATTARPEKKSLRRTEVKSKRSLLLNLKNLPNFQLNPYLLSKRSVKRT
jgi:hypothetical protein